MIKQYANALKQYDLLRRLKIDYYIDAKDQKIWKVGKIKSMRQLGSRTFITIRFDGYPNSWNQEFQLPASNKIATFRRYSMPYTGPLQPTRDIMNDFQIQSHIKAMNRLDFKSSQFINQYFRGQLFILIDYILTRKSSCMPQQFNPVLDLIKNYVLTGQKFLQHTFQNIEQILNDGINQFNLIYVCPKMSALYACIEFLFNFNSLVSKNQRRIKFHQANQRGFPESYKAFKQLLISKNIAKYCVNIMNYKSKSGRGFPWIVKKQALTLLKSLDQTINFPQIIDSKEAMDALDYLPYLVTKQTIKKQFYQQLEISLVILLIVTGSFERKKKGLNQLKNMIQKTQRSFKSNRNTLVQEMQKKKLIQFLIDNNNFNSELFKRSVPAIQFAFRNNLINRQQLSKILSLHKDKHQLQLKTFYGALSQFGRFLDEKTMISFFDEMIKTLPLEQNMIALVKDFTFALTNQHPYFKKLYMQDEQGFGMTYLWNLIQSGKFTGNQQLSAKIIEALASLLVAPFYSKHIEYFIGLSMKAIKDKKAIDSNLKIIHEAMKFCKGAKMVRVIQSLERQMSIIDTVVKAVAQDKSISLKAAQNMFQFLQQVNHVARKGITMAHIKTFWSFKNCRSPLLKFLRKHKSSKSEQKSHERIVGKQLDTQAIKNICQGIFSKPQMMNNYQDVDDQLYQTIDQLLICYNHLMGYIQYNYKHTLRFKKLDSLYGMQIYCNIIYSCTNNLINEKALKRLIEYHLRPVSSPGKMSMSLLSSSSSSEINTKVNAWMAVAKKIGQLNRYTLVGYNLLLTQIKGRMKSLNFLHPDLQVVVVKMMNTNKIKTLNLPRYTSLWKMRQQIGKQFEIQNTNFDIMFNQNFQKTSFQRQEDLSIAVINFPKDQTQPSVLISPSKQPHPHHIAIQNFKAEFAMSSGQTLYQMISIQPTQAEKSLILDILESLPPIKLYEKKIKKLQINKSQDWDQLLDKKCRWKLIYQLKVIKEIKDPKWTVSFLKNNGLLHVANILVSRNIQKQNYKAFTNLMSFFFQLLKFYKTMNSNLPFDDKFVLEIFRLPHTITIEEYLPYFSTCVSVLRQFLNYKDFNFSIFLKHNSITNILDFSLFKCNVTTFPSTLIDLCAKSNKFLELFNILMPFLKFQILQAKQQQCRGFFDLICLIIERNQLNGDIYKKLINILRAVRQNNISQKSYDRPNWLLEGFLKSIKALRKSKSMEEILNQSQEDFFNFIINKCLFNAQNTKSCRFKSVEVRKIGYQMLKGFKDSQKIINSIQKVIQPLMLNGAWRRQYEWNVKPIDFGKKRFTGLRNLAATCYINSLIQQLYYIPSFRQGLLQIDTHQIQDKQNIAYQIQKMFAFLKYSDNLAYSAASLCRTFILDGQPIDPRVQTDVDQFYHTLMDKLQRNFKPINQLRLIQDTFQGEISNLIIGQQCPHTSQRLEQYLSLRLQIKDKNNLQQALEQFIKSQILEGDNSYFCQKCDKKVRALKRQCIKSLPNILLLTLKRFEFDFETMEKFKLNTFCSFPEYLDMYSFTRQGVAQQQIGRQQNYYKYRLKGVVIHYGISQAGHYTSYIRTSGDSWQYFDDDKVQDFNFNDLANQCFGGKDFNPFGEDQDKKKNAYLLFYEKVTVHDQKLELAPFQGIKKQVDEDNTKNQVVRLLFDENLQDLILENGIYEKKLFFLYYHLVVLRNKKNLQKSIQYFQKCQSMITESKQVAQWYLAQANELFLRQFIIFGDLQAKHFVSHLLILCVQKVFDSQFIKRCINCLQRKHMTPFVKIIRLACNSHQEYSKILAQINLGERVMKIIFDLNYINTPSSISQERSAFGRPAGQFVQRKQNSDGIVLLQTIQTLKVNLGIEDIKILSYKAKTKQIQSSLAKIVTKKYKDLQNFTKFFNDYLAKQLMDFQVKSQEYYVYNFYIQLVKQFSAIKDDKSAIRIQKLAQLYLDAMKNSFNGYKAMRMLLEGIFEICFTNIVFRDKISALINQNKQTKKITKTLKEWMKDSLNLTHMVRYDKWGFWRKPSIRSTMTSSLYNQLERQQKIPIQQYMSYINAIVEKHNINYQQPDDFKVGSIVLYEQFNGKFKYKITNKYGLLLELTGQDNVTKLVPEDDQEISLLSSSDASSTKKSNFGNEKNQ